MKSLTRAALMLAALLAVAGAGIPPGPLAAQERGTINGEVVHATTGRPLAGVQVSIPGSGLGTLTNSSGRFLLVNVPAGSVEVRAQLIGYGPTVRTVSVAAGQTVTANFQLAEQALALDEVVVTGTAGQARRREVGNSIAQINVADVAEPVQSVDQLLQSRTPGLIVNESAGMAGAGSQIRLRGSNSIAMSNQPLIYIDGIRVRADAYQKNVPPGDFSGRSGNVTASPLSDIPPEDIDRIEVVKGAAATTLYGTEAAAGVIQIFTKRGRSGAPRWNLQVDQGISRLRPFSPSGTVDFGTRADGERDIYQATPLLNMEPYIRDGWRQNYALSVNGGGEALQYFASGSWSDTEGVMPLDQEEKVGIRGNFTFVPLDKLQLSWNTSYNRTAIQNTPAGNNAHGLTLNAFRQERNYFGNGDPDIIRQVLTYEINTWIDRFITGATANYEPFDNFNNRLTIGYDLANQENRNVRPYGFVAAPAGIISDQRFSSATLTLDYVGSYRLQFGENLSTTLSFGGQSVSSEEVNTIAKGDGLPGPGQPTVSTASQWLGVEERQRVINAGFFGQMLAGWMDKYFLTLGARVDGNSAFGQDFGLQFYPKVSGSYVISEEAFWSEALGSMKLRAAYGQSGRAPGAFDAVKTWAAVGYAGQPAFFPRNLGNANLGPERTAEVELGFDAAFLRNRLTTEFTWYHQKTTDALFRVRQPPSNGWADIDNLTSQLENVGSLRNAGIELGLNGVVIDQPNWGLEVGGSVYTNRSLVLELGEATEFAAGGGWIKEGAPVMAIRGNRIVNAREKADPVVERDVIIGPQQPTHVLTGTTTLRMPMQIELSLRGEYQGGAWIQDGASSNALQRAVRWPSCMDAYRNLNAGQRDELTARERKVCVQSNYENDFIFYPKDFFKLRDVTLRVPVTQFVPGTSNANLTLSARNWFRWTHRDFLMFDPEMVGNEGFGAQNTGITEHIPPAASLIASLRIAF
ncbi:MAG: SusC/RagA family TonB-linked outer membrane protein [Longimicrobiaceae bacterium]